MKRLAIILAAFFMAGPAWAQETQCNGYADAVAALFNQYGETLSVSMMAYDNQIIQVFANEEAQTWTMIQVYANGLACLVTHGTVLEVEPVKGDL